MLEPGAHLGPYELLEPLGSGAMGEVYRARDPRLSRQVAIKVLPEHFSGDPKRLERFRQEALAAGALNHPNITAALDAGQHDGIAYIVFELLDGATLRVHLDAGPLPAKKALDLALQLAHALAAAHAAGVCHRDLKPDNLFVTRGGQLKVLDFGLARLEPLLVAKDSGAATLSVPLPTGPGVILGTVGYMSPEQAAGQPADHRSDIFSFGCVLHHMLTGRPPFRRETSVETMAAILRDDPPPLPPSLPAGLARVVQHCLEKRPEERFQSARDLAFDLAGLSDAPSPGAPSPAPKALQAWRGAALALAAIAAVAALAYRAGHRAGDRQGAERVSFAPLSLRPQVLFRAAFAPDGKTVVFSAALRGNVPELFTLGPEFPQPRPLGPAGAHLLSISARGELAILTKARFLWHRVFTGTLARMALGGESAPRPILDDVRDADWAPDGEGLAIVREVAGESRLEFPVGTVLVRTSGYFSDLRFSRQGDRIAFLEHPVEEDNRGFVAVVDLRGHKSTLSDLWWGVEGLAWSADGSEVLFGAGTGFADFGVRGVSLSGRARTVLQAAGSLILHDVSREGSWLCAREDTVGGMRARGPESGGERDLSLLDTPPSAISRDGRALLFTDASAAAGVNYSVGLRLTDGSPPVRLGEGGALDLSPDGRWALAAIASLPPRLVAYPTGPGEPRQLPRGPIEHYRSGRFFPDGRRVLVCGAEATHAERCYVQDLDGGGPPRAVTPEGTREGLVTPDGTRVLARTASGEHRLFSLDGADPRPVPSLLRSDEVIGWGQDGASILVYTRPEVPARVVRAWRDRGERQPVRDLGPPDLAGVLAISNVSFSADEASYAYGVLVRRSQLYLVEGAR